MEKVIAVGLPGIAYLTDVVVYVVTKTGHYLNKSQARHLIAQGKVRVNGAAVRKPHHLMELGFSLLEVGDRSYPVETLPNGVE